MNQGLGSQSFAVWIRVCSWESHYYFSLMFKYRTHILSPVTMWCKNGLFSCLLNKPLQIVHCVNLLFFVRLMIPNSLSTYFSYLRWVFLDGWSWSVDVVWKLLYAFLCRSTIILSMSSSSLVGRPERRQWDMSKLPDPNFLNQH